MTSVLIYGSMTSGMPIVTDTFNYEIVELLKTGKIGVIRTDTIYGIVGRADDEAAVQRIYNVKKRDDHKPPIVLIATIDHMYDQPDESTRSVVKSVWPGRTSLIVKSPSAPQWLLRGQDTLAYRLPADVPLRQLISLTGPLVAPSANPQSLEPATSIQQAIDFFGDLVDFYVNGGEVIDTAPSQLLRINSDGALERLR